MSRVDSGATTSLVADAGASNGQYLVLNATASGQYMEFTTPYLASGTYYFYVRYMKKVDNGMIQPSIDGINIAASFSEHGTAGAWNETNRASVTLTSGTHLVRIKVVGTQSPGYAVNLDRVVFQQIAP